MDLKTSELCDLVQGRLVKGDPDRLIHGFAAVDEAGAEDLTFFGGDPRYLKDLKASAAGVALVPVGFDEELAGIGAIVAVDNPSAAFAAVVQEFAAPRRQFVPGVHPSAVIDPSARFDPERVAIGAHVVIEADVEIGDGTTIGHGSVICAATRIGRDCLFHPNVTVRDGTLIGDRVILHSGCVIGSDGFGYELDDQHRFRKIEQIGFVQLDDDVEVGSCTTIDRARFGRTWIGEGTKIDNLVQVAHNCVFGRHCAVAAQAGFPGSVRLGNHVSIGGQAATNGHIRVGDGVVLHPRGGITKDLDQPGHYWGMPAIPIRDAKRRLVCEIRLPDLFERVRQLEKQLEAQSSSSPGGS